MKIGSLIVGIFIGLVAGYGLTKLLSHNQNKTVVAEKTSVKWPWADSLDAVKASPKNHRVVFENAKVRILEVVLKPYEFEKMHTHQALCLALVPAILLLLILFITATATIQSGTDTLLRIAFANTMAASAQIKLTAEIS